MELFRLFGSIFVNNDSANQSIEQTEQRAGNVGQTLGKVAGTAAKWGIAIAGAATVAGGAMFGLAKNTADFAGDIDDAAQRAGTTAEEFQKFAYAAKLSGLEADALEKAMIKQQKAFTDATEGSKSMSSAYQRLGIDINTIGSSDKAFDAVISKLADMKNETERNAIANDIFGKSYADLAPLLNNGAEGIAKLKQEAVAIGAVMSNEAVSAGAEFGDSLDKLKASLTGVTNNLGATFFPMLTQVINFIMTNMPAVQETISQVFAVISPAVQSIIPVVADLVTTLLPQILPIIQKLLPVITNLAVTVLPPLVNIFSQLITSLLPPIIDLFNMIITTILPPLTDLINILATTVLPPLLDAFGKMINALLPPLINFFKVIIDSVMPPLIDVINVIVNTVLPPVIDIIVLISKLIGEWIKIITPIYQTILPVLGEIFKTVFTVIGEKVGTTATIIKDAMEGAKKAFNGIIDFINGVFTGNWSKAWEGVKKIFGGIFDSLAALVKVPMNAVIAVINKAIKSINKIKIEIPDWVPGGGGTLGFNIPTIPSFAVGTRYLPKDMLIQAHEGEMIVPKSENPYANSGGRVLNNSNSQQIIVQNLNVRSDQDIQLIARELYNLQRNKGRGLGMA